MSHEDYIKKRDEILDWKDRAWEEWHKTSKGLDWADSTYVQEVAIEIRERHEREAAQAIDALVLEVIGKDAMYKTITGNELNMSPKSVQELRFEQRRIVQGDKS